jgi:2,3-dihydroxybenzoate decarboxylase
MVARVPYKRIATEEAFATPDMFDAFKKLLASGASDDPGFDAMWGFYMNSPSDRARNIREKLLNIGEARIADMDSTGIDMAVLGLTAPGPNVLDAAAARGIATSANDQVAEAVAKHPTRFVALAAFAPQDPAHAAKEIERGVTKLGLKGAILNSHTHHEYLDAQKFWPIFEACEALDVPLYIHPNTPSKNLYAAMGDVGLEGAVYGFGVETGLHTLRLIVSGVFDRFPKLKIGLGHMGEALPFWFYRLDYMHSANLRSGRYPQLPQLKKKVSHYILENIWITTSGMPWPPTIRYVQEVMGMDRVLYAMDYPYQFVADEVTMQDGLAISDADKKKFFQTNAETLFKITP